MAPDPQPLAAALKRVKELEAQLAALPASSGQSNSDSAYIARLLCDEITGSMRVRRWREPHPFGSTVAREALADVELPNAVTIDAEDVETLPRRVRLRLAKDGADFRVTARLRTDDGSRVVYVVEDE